LINTDNISQEHPFVVNPEEKRRS